MKPIPMDNVKNVIKDLEDGLSYRDISKKRNISIGEISKICRKHNVKSSKNKGGRPHKINEISARYICRNITSGKCDTANQIARMLEQSVDIVVSPQTVRNVLKQKGFKAKFKTKKPAISAKNKRKRLEFANKYKYWTTNDWKYVIW